MRAKKGKVTKGPEDPFAALDPKMKARLRAGQLHSSAYTYEEENEDLFKALSDLPYDQFLELRSASGEAMRGARALKGGGFTDAVGFLKNLDVSAVAPLRKSAGLSKGELLDRIIPQIPNLKPSEKKALKAVLYFKSFKNGGKL